MENSLRKQAVASPSRLQEWIVVGQIGYLTLVLTFAVALYGVGAAAVGGRSDKPAWVESGRHAMLLVFPLLTLSTLSLIVLLVTGQFGYAYVASVTSRDMPLYLKVTALWGGQSGSLVFWSWLMAAFTSAAGMRAWERDRELLPPVIVVTLGTLAFFLSLTILFENPFARLWWTAGGQQVSAFLPPDGASPLVPADGRGLNPLLRHPGMILHPPTLYLGFVAFVIPFAFAIAALVTGRSDDRWIRITRRWTLVAWLFLSLGLILGMRWAYDVLGWGGYWGWDPVEVAALLPWLVGTPFLHSVIIQEKRGMLKQWNMLLIILTYASVILGTFLTRSGVFSSVHAFAQSSIGPMFFVFIVVTMLGSVALLIRRWDSLAGENHLDSMISREALFLLQNLLFLSLFIICAWGLLFPLISELATGQKVTVGPPFYERASGPVWAALLLLMGVAPLSAFGRASWRRLGGLLWPPLALSLLLVAGLMLGGMRAPAALLGCGLSALVVLVIGFEFGRAARARMRAGGEPAGAALWRVVERNRRRYGGYIIHLGVVLMALGILGIEVFQSETQATLARGEQMTLGRYIVTYDDLAQFDTDDGRSVTRAVVTVYRDGRPVAELYPRRDIYAASQQPATIPGVRSTLEDDLYILLVDWQPIAADGATFKVYHNPLVNFVWLGGLVFVLGTLVAAWPDRTEPASPARG